MSSNIHVVLHQTLYPGNIGSSARAMGNMGVRRLILVDPRCEVDSKAKRSAVGCQEILENRTVYRSWDEFYAREGEGLRIGFTARSGKLRPAEKAEELFAELAGDGKKTAPNIYLIFGREDSGLSGEDVEFFHHTCTLETFGSYTSLNLAQAVLLGLYVAQKHLMRDRFPKTNQDLPLRPMFHPSAAIKEWLEALGFDLSARRINAYKVLNQLILRNRPNKKELRILEVVLKQNIRKLKERAPRA